MLLFCNALGVKGLLGVATWEYEENINPLYSLKDQIMLYEEYVVLN